MPTSSISIRISWVAGCEVNLAHQSNSEFAFFKKQNTNKTTTKRPKKPNIVRVLSARARYF